MIRAQRALCPSRFGMSIACAAVYGSERVGVQHLRMTLAGGDDLEAVVRDLTARETECCSFLAFAVTTPAPGRLRLDIEVPAGHVDVLDALADRAAAVRDGS